MVRYIGFRNGFVQRLTIGLSTVLMVGLTLPTFADEESARKLLDATQTLVTEAESDSAAIRLGKIGTIRKNFKLIDVELSDVEGAPKEQLEKEVKALKARTDKLAASGEVNDATAAVESFIAAAKESLDNPDTLERHLKDAEANLKKPDVRKALGEAKVTSFTKQIAALRKASVAQQHDRGIEQLKESLGRLEESWPDTKKAIEGDSESDRNSAIQSFSGRDYQLIEKILVWMPADDDEAKPLIAKFKSLRDPFEQAVAKIKGGEVSERLKRDWDSYLNEYQDWEQETKPATFEQMQKEQSEATSNLGAPKTVALARRATAFLKGSVEENEELKPLMVDARVKSIVGQVVGLRVAAFKKLTGFADSILKEAEATKLNQSGRDRLERFVDSDLRLALEGSSEQAALQERGQKLIEKFDKAAGGSAAEKDHKYEELVKKAQADWPGMLQKYSPKDGFDPAAAASWKGKVIHFAGVSNRLGWDYQPADYDFAMDINGSPVAGRYSPAVQAEVKKVLAETGKDVLPEESYDVVAVVGGPCKIKRRVNREGTVTVEGVKANVEAESWEPVDAVLVNIVALRCGPVAVAVDASSPAAAGKGGGTVGSGSGWHYGKWLTLVLGLLAGGLALIKANFAPLVSLPQVQQVRAKLGEENLGKIGVLLALWGLFGLINGFFFYGLLISGTLFAAGLFAGSDVLVALKILQPAWVEKAKPFGTIIGLACAGAAILQLVTGGMLFII
ncbi:MAG: hypothetical protein JWN70_5487 [Planctomycetaceae bacterium]|nr:hypothetical protein [Planctomycetaceae bacterium]